MTIDKVIAAMEGVSQKLTSKGFSEADVNIAYSKIAGTINWRIIESECQSCVDCKLVRSNKVFGFGSRNSPLMIVGEGPGEDENLTGVPFVGECGHLLTIILEKAKINRDDTYITNVVKCQPPSNREPEQEEVNACSRFLDFEIYTVKPQIILTLGNSAMRAIRKDNSLKITTSRGEFMQLPGGIWVMHTYHPSYILRHGGSNSDTAKSLKAQIWADVSAVTRKLAELGCTL